MKTYLTAYTSIALLQCSVYIPTFTTLFEADPKLFIIAALPLIIGLGVAAWLLGWGVYKIVSKICSVIDERNAKPRQEEL